LPLTLLVTACSGPPGMRAPSTHTILIDIDDHGLAGLWLAKAPNIKGLIARGALAYSRVDIPTHSNQNNMSLLTGQYPDGTNVPANAWLSRTQGFAAPVSLPGLSTGDYLFYDKNPLRTRGDSLYEVARRAGLRSAYFGELPPFEGTADDVYLTMIGAKLGPVSVTPELARQLFTDGLDYPPAVVDRFHFEGPGDADEDIVHFTIRLAADIVRAAPSPDAIPGFMFVWDFLALDDDPTSRTGAGGPDIVRSVEDYDAAIGALLGALEAQGILESTNILFTLDHGKVDTHRQVVLGTHGETATSAADGQLAAAVAAMGPALGVTPSDYALVNEDGDAQIYAAVDGAGTPAGAARQHAVTHALLTIVQSGAIEGLDTSRTMTADGDLGTRRFESVRGAGPHQADILVFPADDWTLNQVDATNAAPGPFVEHTGAPYGRHGGFSVDELYVPLVMAGPAFKRGVVLPHPVEHAEVAATAAWALGGVRLRTAARGPVAAALEGDPGEALPLPADPSGTRELALAGAGFGGAVALAGPPARAAVIIDVAGLYDDEVFADDALADAAAPLRALAPRGARFEDTWARSREWAVNEYQLATGAYPIASPWISLPEDDRTQTVLPGLGLLAMPPPAGRVADPPARAAWRAPADFGDESLFAAARAAGFEAALVGAPDFHALHLAQGAFDVTAATDDAGAAAAVAAQLARAPRSVVLVALGGAREPDRRSARARVELAALAKAVSDVARAAGDALVVVTSRGATMQDDAGADFYGPGTARHVPLVVTGPNVRAGVVSGQPATPADVPATVLFGLGLASRTDFADGTRAFSSTDAAATLAPRAALEGHVLLRAFDAPPLHAPLARYPRRPAPAPKTAAWPP